MQVLYATPALRRIPAAFLPTYAFMRLFSVTRMIAEIVLSNSRRTLFRESLGSEYAELQLERCFDIVLYISLCSTILSSAFSLGAQQRA